MNPSLPQWTPETSAQSPSNPSDCGESGSLPGHSPQSAHAEAPPVESASPFEAVVRLQQLLGSMQSFRSTQSGLLETLIQQIAELDRAKAQLESSRLAWEQERQTQLAALQQEAEQIHAAWDRLEEQRRRSAIPTTDSQSTSAQSSAAQSSSLQAPQSHRPHVHEPCEAHADGEHAQTFASVQEQLFPGMQSSTPTSRETRLTSGDSHSPHPQQHKLPDYSEVSGLPTPRTWGSEATAQQFEQLKREFRQHAQRRH